MASAAAEKNAGKRSFIVADPLLAKAAGEHNSGSKPRQAPEAASETRGFCADKGLIDF
jgi:hypothetical protein